MGLEEGFVLSFSVKRSGEGHPFPRQVTQNGVRVPVTPDKNGKLTGGGDKEESPIIIFAAISQGRMDLHGRSGRGPLKLPPAPPEKQVKSQARVWRGPEMAVESFCR